MKLLPVLSTSVKREIFMPTPSKLYCINIALGIHLLLAIFKILLIQFGFINLSSEEAQYWLWSQHLDWSYYSKPPLVAYANAFSDWLLPHSELMVRINAVMIGILLGWIWYRFTYELFKDAKTAFIASIIPLGMPFFHYTTFFFAPDSLLVLFWLLSIFYFYLSVTYDLWRYWIAFGVCIGLGFLSKYLSFLFLPTALLYALVFKRNLFSNPKVYVSAFISGLFTLPVIIWSIQHDWVNFLHVSTHAGSEKQGFEVQEILGHFVEFIPAQLGASLLLLLPIGIPAIIYGFRNWNNPKIFLLIAPFFTILGLFFSLNFFNKVEVNWVLFGYVTLPILLAFYIRQTNKWKITQKWLFLSSGLIVILFCIVSFPNTKFASWLPGKNDPFKKMRDWEQTAQIAERSWKAIKNQKAFIFTPSYHIASHLSFYMNDSPHIYCIDKDGRRMNQFDFWQTMDEIENQCYTGLFIDRNPIPDHVEAAFVRKVDSTTWQFNYKQDSIYTYHFVQLEHFKTYEIPESGKY